ncbi:sulfotransferase domain-containing protein [Methylopila sp. 73B]|uniref:sulfotransferase domain-containing protein n=1 Tax=Methylopila sp. 73B TaxID=1120792 RepID=UPI003204EDEF
MLYVCFGMEKGGSTYTYYLTQALFESLGHPHVQLSPEHRGDAKEQGGAVNNVRDWQHGVVRAIRLAAPSKALVTLRTHASPSDSILRMLSKGKAKLSVAIRDPRDLALSLMDVATRRQALGRPFLQDMRPNNLTSSFSVIEANIARVAEWTSAPDALLLYYEETAFSPALTIEKICRHLQLEPPKGGVEAITLKAASWPNGKRNVAHPHRHRHEMSAQDQEIILDRFSDFYARYFPDARVVTEDNQGTVDADG